jgi:hypothetical protein
MIFIKKRKCIHLLKRLSAATYGICSTTLQREKRRPNEVAFNMGN